MNGSHGRFGTRTSTTALVVAAALACGAAAPLAAADWTTHRGNAARTGCLDGLPGPKAPKVLWVHKTRENLVAAPVPGPKLLYVSGLGAFNTAALHALETDPAAAKRVAWSKVPPALKLPVVCAPALLGDRLVFGDGMHQTDGASLHAVHAATGLPEWRLDVPGQLVHIEGAPTIAEGKVFVGAGHAGVICASLDDLAWNGRPVTAAAAREQIAAQWKKLVDAYEIDKKKDPDFAVPPSESDLSRPSPRIVWQQGQGRWHVDAPVAVVGGKVFVASAFLDVEKSGDRALFCLSATDGKPLWRAALPLNPWAGASVAGDLLALGGSNIRLDPKTIPQAKGDVTVLNAADGSVKWRKDLPAGIVSSVAVADGLVVACGTDGRIRGFDLSTGEERWSHAAGAAFFAGPAVAGGLVYAADLKGTVHAVDLAKGTPKWTLSLATDPAVGGGGPVYGSPVVHGGRLYVATCDLESGGTGRMQVVACIGEK